MSKERETRTETDFWGNKHEYLYEDGNRVGAITTEQRGGFLGIGAETVKVERDTSGNETSYTKQETRGGLLGIGSESQETRYGSQDREIGASKIERRGGFLGIGSQHARVERDNEGAELSQTASERRGGILGVGGERVRVTTYSDAVQSRSDSAPGNGRASTPDSHANSTATEKSSGSAVTIVTLLLLAFLGTALNRSMHPPVSDSAASAPLPVAPAIASSSLVNGVYRQSGQSVGGPSDSFHKFQIVIDSLVVTDSEVKLNFNLTALYEANPESPDSNLLMIGTGLRSSTGRNYERPYLLDSLGNVVLLQEGPVLRGPIESARYDPPQKYFYAGDRLYKVGIRNGATLTGYMVFDRPERTSGQVRLVIPEIGGWQYELAAGPLQLTSAER